LIIIKTRVMGLRANTYIIWNRRDANIK